MIKTIVQVGISATVVSVALIVGSSGSATAAPTGRCGGDWRGDTVCIHAAGTRVSAQARDDHPGATVYLEIVNGHTGNIVAGPVVDRSIHATLPPGRYYADYYVASTNYGDAQVTSPVVLT